MLRNKVERDVNLSLYLKGMEKYIKNEVKSIASVISMSSDAQSNNYVNFVMLEGETDYAFFKRNEFQEKFDNSNYYIKIKDIIDFTQEQTQSSKKHYINHKDLIIKIAQTAIFLNLPHYHKVFGIVDRDFDDEYPQDNVTHNNVLSNDTHDLETLILSTDIKIINKFVKNITSEIYFKILYMAYQLGCVKQAIWENPKYLQYNVKHSFDQYFNGDKLNIHAYVQYLKTISNNKTAVDEKIIIKNLRRGGVINNDNEFTVTFDIFKNNFPQDTWYIVNGHDVSSILIYLSNNKLFDIEKKLIEFYDPNMFIHSNLYKKMKTSKLIN